MTINFGQGLILLSQILLALGATYRLGGLLQGIRDEVKHTNEKLQSLEQRVLEIEKVAVRKQ